MDGAGAGAGRAMSGSKKKPQLAAALLWLSLPRRERIIVMADLEEEYRNDILTTLSHRQARVWYWREAISLMRWYLISRIRKYAHHDLRQLSPSPIRSESGTIARSHSFIQSVLQDIQFGIRSLRRRPLFTAVAVITLGLGIGATTTMFSAVDGVLLRPLSYEDPGKLVSVWLTHLEWRGHPFFGDYWDRGPLDFSQYETWRDATTQFRSVAVHGEHTMTVTEPGEPEQLSVGLASAGLFQTLGAHPLIGRGFLPGEDGPTAKRVVVLSSSLWRTRFAADPAVLGRTLTLDGNAYSVVGVLPAGFRLSTLVLGTPSERGDRAAWIPIGQPEILGGLDNQDMEGIGRLAPGVSIEQARAETDALFAGEERPPRMGAGLVFRKNDETGGYSTPLFLLLGAAGILLLTACCNVAMLAMGEATGRRHEITIRAALGARIPRIVRQILTESVLLGLLGSALGALLAFAGTSLLVSLGPPIPRLDGVHMSTRVLLFASSAGIATGVLFGLAPSALFARGSAGPALRGAGTRTITGGHTVQRHVVSLEIALTAVLLVAGGLLTRSLANIFAIDPGFDAPNVATLHVPLPESRYATGADVSAFFREVQQRIEAVPGVVSASGTAALPFGEAFYVETPVFLFEVVGRESQEDERSPQALRGTALPHLHETLGVPVLSGRGFTDADGANASRVLVINETMARRYWRDESPIGATVELGNDTWTVVGIVGDVRHVGLGVDVEPMFHLPSYQHPTHGMSLVARTEGDPRRLLPQLRKAVWSVDANVPVTRVNTMTSLISESGSDERYRTLLMLVFSITAVVLATTGIFGVTAQGVANRTREMGIRMALGARENGLVGMVLRGSLFTTLVGTAIGLVAALWATRLLSQFLFAVETSDPLTYGTVALLLVMVCLVASYFPARRASRVDPVEVLRAE